MGWKTSLIFIKNIPDIVSDKQVLDALLQPAWMHTKDASFEEAMNAEDGKTYIGRLNDTLVIGHSEIPLEFISDGLSAYEKNLDNLSPQNLEICGISLQSTVNHWGYGVIANGQKIRARGGNYQKPLFFDYGNPLPEEEPLLSTLIIKENGSHFYNIDGNEYTDDQVGENFVFALTKRYIGVSLNSGDNPLDNLKFRCYEKNPYFDNRSKAELPGELTIADDKFAKLEPEQYGYSIAPLKNKDGQSADIKQYISSALQNGACNPAFVYQISPLVIVVYAYDMDCVIPILFPKEYQPHFELTLNQRLLSVNMFGTNNNIIQEDLIEGKDSTGDWKDFAPHIAELYSDDISLIKEKKAAIEEKYWEKLVILTKEYFEVFPKRYRLGINGYTGFRLEYTKPEPLPIQTEQSSNKKWWKFWNS